MEHDENTCDACGEVVGKENLLALPFLYYNKNDVAHKVERNGIKHWCNECGELHALDGYCQYYVCETCYKTKVY